MNSFFRPRRALAAGAAALLLPAVTGCITTSPGPPLPTIPRATFNVLQYGAVGDGKTMNTAAIQMTIDTAGAAGGGTVLVPAGNFLTGPFVLTNNINLHLARHAVILISDDLDHYPSSKARFRDSITASGAHDIEISGAGAIDGQGRRWWTAFRQDPVMTHRPYMIKLSDCTRLFVHGVTLRNSPMFHLVPQNCTDVTIRGITISAPANAPNTDGIDPSGWNYLIAGCTIDTGDDNIAIKPVTGRSPGNHNYRITGCTFRHGHGCSVGSGTTGGLADLIVSDCTFDQTDAGIRIKTLRGNGGRLEDCRYEDLRMSGVRNPIYIIDWYPERDAPKDPETESAEPVTARTPFNQDITIRNVFAVGCTNAGIIRGLPEAPITNILLDHVTISARNGMKIYHARDIRFVNSNIAVENGPRLTTSDADVAGLP